MTTRRSLAAAALALAAAAPASAAGDDTLANQVWEDAARAAAKGPVDVPLLDEAVLKLPAAEVFVPQPQAERLLATLGDRGKYPGLVGVVLPRDPRATWHLTLRFRPAGFVREDAAAPWDADALLQAVRDAAAASGVDREVVGWTQPPRLDTAQHRFAWALATRAGDAAPESAADGDVEAELLGRDGDLRLSLATRSAEAASAQAVVAQHADAIAFVAGKRYADFAAGADRVASGNVATLLVSAAAPSPDANAPRRGFASRHVKSIVASGAGLLVLLAALAAWRIRRRRRRISAQSFGSTISGAGPGVSDNRPSAPRRDA
ncbi:MAG TPA: DUF2167 domain-containing protein [Burkholderiaceae bacterium]